jgi:hypothetical protein
MSRLDTDLLGQLVRARHTCLRQLRDIGLKQMELVRDGNMTALLDLLSAKQRPLVELRRIESALEPFRGQAPETRLWRTAEDRAACARQVEECEAMLREIIVQEKECETTLVRRRDEAAVQLQFVHSAGQARGAYTAPSRTQASQLDLQVGS